MKYFSCIMLNLDTLCQIKPVVILGSILAVEAYILARTHFESFFR